MSEIIEEVVIGERKYRLSRTGYTLYINEEREAAEYVIGAWGADVNYGYDNRVFENDDYKAVIEWLNKIAQAGEKEE